MLFVGGKAFESTTAPCNVQGSGKHRCSVLFKRFHVSLTLASVILEAAVQYFSVHEDSEMGRNLIRGKKGILMGEHTNS